MFKPSKFFYDWLNILKEILQFKHSIGVGIFLWFVSPLLLPFVLGAYIADIIIED